MQFHAPARIIESVIFNDDSVVQGVVNVAVASDFHKPTSGILELAAFNVLDEAFEFAFLVTRQKPYVPGVYSDDRKFIERYLGSLQNAAVAAENYKKIYIRNFGGFCAFADVAIAHFTALEKIFKPI